MRGFWNGGAPPFGYDFDFVKAGNNMKQRLKFNETNAQIVKKFKPLIAQSIREKILTKENIKKLLLKTVPATFWGTKDIPWAHSRLT